MRVFFKLVKHKLYENVKGFAISMSDKNLSVLLAAIIREISTKDLGVRMVNTFLFINNAKGELHQQLITDIERR